MSVAPVIQQLRSALRERTRLENDFKTKILNRINAILEQLNDCDRASLPPAAAGVLNIAIGDLNDIVREIRNPVNMTDAHVEEIVEPLERRRRNNTVRLLPAGRPVDGPRSLSAPGPAAAVRPFSMTDPSTWGRSTPAPVELGRLADKPPSYESAIASSNPAVDSIPRYGRYDELRGSIEDDDLSGYDLSHRSALSALPKRGGTRRKYRRKV